MLCSSAIAEPVSPKAIMCFHGPMVIRHQVGVEHVVEIKVLYSTVFIIQERKSTGVEIDHTHYKILRYVNTPCIVTEEDHGGKKHGG